VTSLLVDAEPLKGILHLYTFYILCIDKDLIIFMAIPLPLATFVILVPFEEPLSFFSKFGFIRFILF